MLLATKIEIAEREWWGMEMETKTQLMALTREVPYSYRDVEFVGAVLSEHVDTGKVVECTRRFLERGYYRGIPLKAQMDSLLKALE